MPEKKKINEYGNLLPDFSLENSKFFKLLTTNDMKSIEDWLINNGTIKPYCPIRFLSNNKEELYVS